jgi:hypothetical protein
MDELTLLAISEVIKAEAGVTHHRIINPSREDGFLPTQNHPCAR